MTGNGYRELKFKASSCSECPCLRNNKDGEFTCFFNEQIFLDYYDLDVIYGACPLLSNEEENDD